MTLLIVNVPVSPNYVAVVCYLDMFLHCLLMFYCNLGCIENEGMPSTVLPSINKGDDEVTHTRCDTGNHTATFVRGRGNGV